SLALPSFLALVLVIVHVNDLDPRWLLGALLVAPLLGAAGLGTYGVVRLVRTRKGRLEMRRRTYIGFIPFPERSIHLDRCERIVIDTSKTAADILGFSDWQFLLMTLGFGFIGAVSGFLLHGSGPRFAVRLVGKRPRDSIVVYRGRDQSVPDDVISVLAEVTHLPLPRAGQW